MAERFHEWPHLGTPLITLASVPLTVVKFVGIATVAAAILDAPRRDSTPRVRGRLLVTFALFAVIPTLATILAGDPFPTKAVSYLVSIALMMFATRRLVSNQLRMKTVIRALVAIVSLSTFWAYKQRFIEHRAEYFVWGVSEDSNYEALSILVVIPLALCVARLDPARRWRRLGVLGAVAMAGAVTLTESRGGVIGLASIVLGEFLSRRTALYKSCVALAIAIAVLAAPSNLWRRMKSIQISGTAVNEAAESTEVRWQVLIAGMHMIQAHPVFGVGLDEYKPLSVSYNDALQGTHGNIAHNTYMQVAAEGGLVALGLFVALMIMALRNCATVRKFSEHSLGDLAAALKSSIIAYAIAAFFLSATYQVFYWLLITLSENLRDMMVAEVSSEERRFATDAPNQKTLPSSSKVTESVDRSETWPGPSCNRAES